MGAVRNLECAVCGDSAGRYAQHWNRDRGFGVCRRCVDWLLRTGRATPDDITELYGVEGVNYAPHETRATDSVS